MTEPTRHVISFAQHGAREDLALWMCSCGETGGAFARRPIAERAAGRHLDAVTAHPDLFAQGFADGVTGSAETAVTRGYSRDLVKATAYSAGLRSGRYTASKVGN